MPRMLFVAEPGCRLWPKMLSWEDMLAAPTELATPDLIAKYEPVIGLEIHCQLATRTKIFCGCPTSFGAAPNTNVCPVCLALPGALPVLNREAVELAIKSSIALNCKVNPVSRFARKNYFYPDSPRVIKSRNTTNRSQNTALSISL